MKADLVIGGKRLTYDGVVSRELDRGSEIYEAGERQVARMVRLSLQGGPCLRCGEAWERVEVDNKFAAYEYWRPACGCYPTCRRVLKYQGRGGGSFNEGCGRKLYEELEGAVWQKDGHSYVRCGNCRTVIQVDRYILTREELRDLRRQS